MMRFSLLTLALLVSAFSPHPAAKGADYAKEIEPILVDYCFDCHGDGMTKGDFSLDEWENLDEHLQDIDLWMTVWEHTRSQIMPPADKKQPPPADRAKLISWIQTDVFKVDPENPDPGRVTVRRMNREEYKNTIQDIFGHRFNTDEAFPPDDTGYGFDNIGDVLSISPLLMEKYVEAAREIVSEVAHTSGPLIPTEYLGADRFATEEKNRKSNWVPFDEPGVFVRKFNEDHPGEYRMVLEYRINGAENDTDNTARLIVRTNGKEVLNHFLAWGDTQTVRLEGNANFKDGENRIEIELVKEQSAKDGQRKLALQVQNMRLQGPMDGSHRVFPSEYNKIFLDGPPEVDAGEQEAYLRKLIGYWGRKLWRRPVAKKDEDRLVALANLQPDGPQKFEKGFAQALVAMMASPKFLFRAEIQPEPDNPGKVVPVDEFALAARLSYFLWQSCPDDTLLDLAENGELRKNLRQQVDRMIKDGKSERFVRSFTGQWLEAKAMSTINIDANRILGTRDNKEAERFFNYRTREAMRRETEMLFSYVLKEDRSALELLTADYTFLNEDLARTYGIDGVKGRDMRKVDLPKDSPRGGILGQGTFLVVTSNPTRTSPVKRGLYVLENLLAMPAPPPPEEVPSVEEQRQKKENRELSMRELMQAHAESKLCASCHARFDPIGFALENYNAIGQWRDEERGKPIEAGGKLITGEPFADAKELSKVLATSRKGDFYRCMAEKLLTYATGRGVEYFDAPTVDAIVTSLEKDGKMSSLIYGVIESAPFQKRRGDGDALKSGKD